MSIYDAPRVQFVVINWDKETKRGYTRDREGFEYLVTVSHLAPECEGQLVKDDDPADDVRSNNGITIPQTSS